MPIHRKESTLAERVQALTLHAVGKSYTEIEALTGIRKEGFRSLLKKAKSRGYIPGNKILDEHVINASRTGRPPIILPDSEEHRVLEETLNKNSTTVEYSAQELADDVKERLAAIPGTKVPSRRTVLRWLKKEGYKSVKHTTKVGLKKSNMMTRLEFCLKVVNWTLEDWKKVVWSDETAVVLGSKRGKRNVWRKSKDRYHRFVTRRRWKGRMCFMFWACFAYDHKGPYYCWPKESAAMKKKYEQIMETYNEAHEMEDKKQWEVETAMRRIHLDRKHPGRKPKWRYTKATGKMVRDSKAGGIDWIRYQHEVLRPKFIPFVKKLGFGFIAQEDNASSHSCKWNKGLWEEAGLQVLQWPANSPDLSAIESPWYALKTLGRKQKVPTSQKALRLFWAKAWKDFSQDKLRRYVERIQGHIRWVIRLAGDNRYKEGTEPLPLPEGEEEPGVIALREWQKKTTAERMEEDPTYQDPAGDGFETEDEGDELDLHEFL